MLCVQKYHNFSKVYGYNLSHFGDTWAYTNLLLRLSEGNGKPVRVGIENQKLKKLILQIRPFLKSKGRIVFSNRRADLKYMYCDPYKIKFVPAIRTWNYKRALKSKIVAYQFDGIHLSEEKNLPPHRIKVLLSALRKMGYTPVNVGGHKKIDFIINTLSNCKFFIGCPSGLSVAARSVKCPIFLITWKLGLDWVNWIKNCQCPTAKFFVNVGEFLRFTKITQSKLITLL